MLSTTLYLGIDAPPTPNMFHYPVIRTERIDSPQLQQALQLQERCTHWIFTSKNGVRHWPNKLLGSPAFVIGSSTAEEVRLRGAVPFMAPEATQEGVITLLKTADLKDVFLLYPHSRRARSLLSEYLQCEKIPHFSFDLYDTLFQRLEPVPDLNDFDEILFTSPSTVQGFSLIFLNIPARVSLRAIGPVTQKALHMYNCSRARRH